MPFPVLASWIMVGLSAAGMTGGAIGSIYQSGVQREAAESNAASRERLSGLERERGEQAAMTEMRKQDLQAANAQRLADATEDVAEVRNNRRVWETQRRLDRALDRASDLRNQYFGGNPTT